MRRILPYLLSLIAMFGISACLSQGNISHEQPSVSAESSIDADEPIVLHNPSEAVPTKDRVRSDGSYTDKDQVSEYIHIFGKLPGNYITKQQAQNLGWDSQKGNLTKVAPGKSIGGDKFGNYEGQLPKAQGRKYYECDIDYGGGHRGAKRIIYSNDGLVFYTDDHYKTFTQLY